MGSAELLKSLRSLVAYHRSCGLEHYRYSEALISGLERFDSQNSASIEATRTAAVIRPTTESPVQQEPASGDLSSVAVPTLEELAAEIRSCRLCPLHEGRKVSIAGAGGAKPRMLVIGDWLVHDGAEEEALFGTRQDQMLVKMMAAMELDMSQVFITNVIKCSVAASLKPDSTHIGACLSYLSQQISVLAPEVICTMGAAPSQALLGSTLPLIRLRGRFHNYRTGADINIPVMPTFHPSFLLKNPEMKQSTWEDLQLIRKRLHSS